MYGDYFNSSSSVEHADVWVLSIPSFQWHRAGQRSSGRLGHSCSVAGQRQMVIIGGFRADGRDRVVGDNWSLGLGVFDLSEMVYKDGYDADASGYTSPDVVKRWYAKNGPMAKDISEDVKGLFDRSSTADSSVSSSVPTSTEIQPSSDSSSSGSVNTGAIAGGVVGGVVVLVAIIAGIWICIRRRRRRRNRMSNISQPFIPQPYESDSRAKFEVDGQQTQEIEARQRHELL